jgi:hypothetical protein
MICLKRLGRRSPFDDPRVLCSHGKVVIRFFDYFPGAFSKTTILDQSEQQPGPIPLHLLAQVPLMAC